MVLQSGHQGFLSLGLNDKLFLPHLLARSRTNRTNGRERVQPI